jgi:iron complex transport system substrate-binding protein
MRIKCLQACAGLLPSQMTMADALPRRWVSAGGAFSEWVVALAGEGKLVGVDSTSQHPRPLHSVPSVGYPRAKAFYPSAQAHMAGLPTTESAR